MLADEQNGFRKQRSCEDHVFTLNSLIKNNSNVFTAFIDLKRCFDYVDRDMLLYKLLLHHIDWKFYNSIKSIYTSTMSVIRINNKLMVRLHNRSQAGLQFITNALLCVRK